MGRENEFKMFDWAMKHMLRDKTNFEILEGLVSVLLGQDIKIKEILESESNQEDDSDKFNRVDIKAVNSQGHVIIVEIQLTRQCHSFSGYSTESPKRLPSTSSSEINTTR